MAPEEALAHIRAGAGTHFDPVVVKALEDVLRDDGITTDRQGEAATAWAAAERCHEIDREDELVGV